MITKGYRVRVIGRDVSRKEDHDLFASFGAKEGQVEWVKGEFGGYDDAVKGSLFHFFTKCTGCDGVFHVASPYIYSAPDPQKEIVDPAVNGMEFRNTLNSRRKIDVSFLSEIWNCEATCCYFIWWCSLSFSSWR